MLNKFNYVQIRLNHDIDDYLLTAYYLDKTNINNDGELFIFYINKKVMIDLILKHGHYAHGTIKKNGNIIYENLINVNNTSKYALRPQYNDDCWKKLLEYKILTISDL
jgi:hypothetical protein